MNKNALTPSAGLITKDGLQPTVINIDGYVSMMESAAVGARGAAGMGSPTANRMKARTAEGMIPLSSMIAGETSGIGWRIIAEPVQAAMVNGFEIITKNADDKQKIKDFFDDNGFWDAIEKAVILKRHHGWAVMVMGESWLRCHGAHWITPSDDWYTDYNSPLFGLPEGWRIQLRAPIGDEVFIEQTDSILFGDKDYQPVMTSGRVEFGLPVLARVYAALQRLGLSHELILSILSLSVQDIYKKTDLHEDLKTTKGEADLSRRFAGIVATRQLNDMVGIDADEDIQRLQSSMTGVADIIDMAIKLVSAETGFPVSMLADRKGGLSNSDTSADAQWQNLVSCIISQDVIPALKFLAMRYLGIRADFMPNKSQGQIDREVERDFTIAKTAEIYYKTRGINSEEVRETARRTGAVELLSAKPPATGTIDEAGGNNDNPDDDKQKKPDDVGGDNE